MTLTWKGISAGVVVALTLTAVITSVSAQTGQPARAPESGAADPLLVEVRALRAELKQAASLGIRMQLMVARLQLQEQRVDSAARQLVQVRTDLASAEQAQAAMAGPLAGFLGDESPEKAEQQKAMAPLKAMLTAHRQRADELRAQESTLVALLASEQGRWTEFNQRLEEIERTLPAPTPR